ISCTVNLPVITEPSIRNSRITSGSAEGAGGGVDFLGSSAQPKDASNARPQNKQTATSRCRARMSYPNSAGKTGPKFGNPFIVAEVVGKITHPSGCEPARTSPTRERGYLRNSTSPTRQRGVFHTVSWLCTLADASGW